MAKGSSPSRNSAMMAYFRRPVDLGSLVFFRIMTGLLLSIELLYSLKLGDLWEYTHPGYHFHYQWFEWVKPFGETGMKLVYAAGITAGLFVAAGFLYRAMSAVLFFCYMCLLLMEATQYVNHLYLYCLLSFWMMLLPLHRNGSVDAMLFPERRSHELPFWMLRLFQFQIGAVYFYAGVAKLHPDWLSGRMMNLFLSTRGIHHEELAQVMAYGGLVFDLFIVPLLIWKRSRVPAFMTAILFHMTNVVMFGLGSFPWFALLSCTLYFSPEWPGKIPLLRRIYSPGEYVTKTGPLIASFVCLYVVVQALLPLRQHLYPHDAGWSEEGHNYSWRMKTRIKRGVISYRVRDLDSGYVWRIDPSSWLTETQLRDLGGNPEFILQFAHFLRDEYRKKGFEVEVFARAKASLNAYPYETLIDPRTDLARVEQGLMPYDWIKSQRLTEYHTADSE